MEMGTRHRKHLGLRSSSTLRYVQSSAILAQQFHVVDRDKTNCGAIEAAEVVLLLAKQIK
jgi:hypothetical protein